MEELKHVKDTITPDDERRRDIRGFFNKLKRDASLLFLSLLICSYFFYLAYTTTLQPNTYYISVYNPLTQKNESVAQTHVQNNGFVPINPMNNSIGRVTYTNAFIGSLFVFALVYYVLTKITEKRMITILEAREITKQYLLYYRDVLKDSRFDGTFTINPPFFLMHTQKTNEERTAHKYNLEVTIIHPEGHKTYYLAQIHPYSKYFLGFLPRKFPLSELDRCPNCGSYSDIKIVSLDDYRTFREVMKSGPSSYEKKIT